MGKKCIKCGAWAMKNSEFCLNHNPDRPPIIKELSTLRPARNYKLSTLQGIKNACITAIKGLVNKDDARHSASILVGIEKYIGILKGLRELEPTNPGEEQKNRPLSDKKKEELKAIVKELQDLHTKLSTNPYAQKGEQGKKEK